MSTVKKVSLPLTSHRRCSLTESIFERNAPPGEIRAVFFMLVSIARREDVQVFAGQGISAYKNGNRVVMRSGEYMPYNSERTKK